MDSVEWAFSEVSCHKKQAIKKKKKAYKELKHFILQPRFMSGQSVGVVIALINIFHPIAALLFLHPCLIGFYFL